jgi:hypothetical protein
MQKGCLEGWIRLFPSLFWVILGIFLFPFFPRIGWSNSNFFLGFTLSLPIQKSAIKTIAADSEIGIKIVSLPNPKSTAKNFIVADSEIGRKTVALPIQTSMANYPATDSDICSQLCRCRIRN